MSERERPLPEPSKPAFGRKGRHEESEGQRLMADELALAAAEGRLDDFMSKEVPDNDYARELVSMMMGMTGMAPAGNPGDIEAGPVSSESKEEETNPSDAPPEVVAAVRGGDVQQLMGLLQKEYLKRFCGEEQDMTAETRTDKNMKPTIERDVIEALVKIASDNDVSLDWLTLRALKLYVQEYQKTGRL